MCNRYVLSYWLEASGPSAERAASNDQAHILKGALGLGMVQLHIGALSYHADFFGHQPESFEANPTLRAALCPGLRRRDLHSQGAPDADSCSASGVHLQAQALAATRFVSAKSRLKPVAHFVHCQLRAEEL